MVIWIEDKILPVIQMPFGWRTIQGSDYFQPFEHRTHSKNKICVSGYQPMALIVAGGGAWKHYVFGIHMVKCVRISNGLQFSKGLGKITAIVFRFWMVCSDFKWFGFEMVGTIAIAIDGVPKLWASASSQVHICATEYRQLIKSCTCANLSPNKCSSQSCVPFSSQQHTTNNFLQACKN